MASQSIVHFPNVFSLKRARTSRRASARRAVKSNEIKNLVLILRCLAFQREGKHFVFGAKDNEALKLVSQTEFQDSE